MKYYFPYHLGSGNRGCEGILRGILNILNIQSEEAVAFSSSNYDYKSDQRLGLDQICSLKFNNGCINNLSVFVCKVARKLGFASLYDNYMCRYYLHDVKKSDFVFITGGDIYCYDDCPPLPSLIAKKSKSIGAITVLFGVSMDKQYLTESVISGLRNFDVIISRDTISSKSLSDVGLENYLYPDPAFSLSPVQCKLPVFFAKNNVVGINISCFTNESPLFKENIKLLIDYILSQNMIVCFFPHVYWELQDDRVSINEISRLYDSNVYVLDSENLTYLEIRYAISKCCFFVGARTHSVISAYSTQTPCLALGYSIKSVGIAKDIGLPANTVINSKEIESPDDFLLAFKSLQENETIIRDIYTKNMPSYISKTFEAKDKLMDNNNYHYEVSSEGNGK